MPYQSGRFTQRVLCQVCGDELVFAIDICEHRFIEQQDFVTELACGWARQWAAHHLKKCKTTIKNITAP